MEYQDVSEVQYLVGFKDDSKGNCYLPEWVSAEFLKLDHKDLILQFLEA